MKGADCRGSKKSDFRIKINEIITLNPRVNLGVSAGKINVQACGLPSVNEVQNLARGFNEMKGADCRGSKKSDFRIKINEIITLNLRVNLCGSAGKIIVQACRLPPGNEV
jgi:hypothetical protein